MRYGGRAALVAATAVLALVVGCGGDDSDDSGSQVKAPEGPKAATEVGAGEGQVNLIAWAG
jgi:putative spermidine/putrescine transport system substrate-binding protein